MKPQSQPQTEQPSLFDMPADRAAQPVATQSAPVSTPTPVAPTSQQEESERVDRRSYASLADYISGRW